MTLLDSCGSAEALVRTVAPLDEDGLRRVVASGLTAGWHTVPDRYSLVGGQSLGLMLGPVLRLLGVDDEALATFDAGGDRHSAAALCASCATALTPFPRSPGVGPDASPAALWNAALDEAAEGAARIVRATERGGRAGGRARPDRRMGPSGRVAVTKTSLSFPGRGGRRWSRPAPGARPCLAGARPGCSAGQGVPEAP